MTAILGVFTPPDAPGDDGRAAHMLGAMARRGADRATVVDVRPATLAVSRHAWELDAEPGGGALVVREGELAIAADATLYYRGDLERALRATGVLPASSAPAHLILAAYRAWGEQCAAYLEGDFAFVIWDARVRRAFAARDFAGKRPLFHARAGDSWVVASSIAAILRHPELRREIDVAVLAEEAAALTGSNEETVWRGVRRVAPGTSLSWRAGHGATVARWWEPPRFRDDDGGTSFEEGAEELRELLCAAVAERLATRGRTTVCLSGGWDSPAVYACGQRVLRRERSGRTLDAISVSFPEGDPGREDEIIAPIVRHWSADTSWIRSDDIPPLAGIVERAAARDEPFPHPFEMMNRAMARAAPATGARVLLDGNGGDQLFQVSDVFLADLLAGGRWLALAREWRASRAGRGGVGARAFLADVVAPAMPLWARRGARPPMERALPSWLRADFVRAHGLRERERAHVPARRGVSRAAHECAVQLARPLLGRMAADLGAFALEAGVEHRSPLHDARIVAFAASRPRAERRSGLETKRLLRRAMTGLLPASVLAPRRYRTGVPIRYFVSGVHAAAPLVERMLSRAPMLAELGIAEPAALARAWDDARRRGDAHGTVALYLALEAELWLRAHTGGAATMPPVASTTTPAVEMAGD